MPEPRQDPIRINLQRSGAATHSTCHMDSALEPPGSYADSISRAPAPPLLSASIQAHIIKSSSEEGRTIKNALIRPVPKIHTTNMALTSYGHKIVYVIEKSYYTNQYRRTIDISLE